VSLAGWLPKQGSGSAINWARELRKSVKVESACKTKKVKEERDRDRFVLKIEKDNFLWTKLKS
jgi:hypothetical protein